MAGKPGGSAPGGVPTFWAQTLGPVGQQPDTTHILRAPTYVPFFAPPFHRYIQKNTDYISGLGPTTAQGTATGVGSAVAVGLATDTAHVLRAPIYTPTWRIPYRVENLGWISQRTTPVAVTVSVTGSASGVGTASGIGASTAASTGSASGVGTASGIGAAAAPSTGSAAGVGSASATGASAAASVGLTTGTGTATGVSTATAAAAQARAPLFTPTWQRWRLENLGWIDRLTFQIIPPEGNQTDWPNPRGPQWPISLRTWVGGRVGAAAVAGASGTGSATGTGTASGIGASAAASTGSAAGVGAANGVGESTAASVGNAAGTGTAVGIADVGTSTGSASGTGTATAVGAATAASTGSASGTGTATATGAATDASTGTAAGVGAASGIGASTAASVGTASGTGTATGVGDFTLAGQSTGSASGTGTAAAIGASTAAAVGNASGTGTATGRSPDLAAPAGGAGFVHTFSRKRWRELQALIAAEQAAVAKAERLTTPAKREPLLQAARAAAAAVDAAQVEGENKRLDALLLRNADTLRKAIRANTEVKLLRETASAIEQSHAIVARNDDDEDMISILLLL